MHIMYSTAKQITVMLHENTCTCVVYVSFSCGSLQNNKVSAITIFKHRHFSMLEVRLTWCRRQTTVALLYNSFIVTVLIDLDRPSNSGSRQLKQFLNTSVFFSFCFLQFEFPGSQQVEKINMCTVSLLVDCSFKC